MDQARAFAHLARVLAVARLPSDVFRAVDGALKTLVGHRVLLVQAAADDALETAHSSDPALFALGSRRRPPPTRWSEQVLAQQRAWLGRDRVALREAFHDSARLEGIGCAAFISVPVVAFGDLVGAISLFDREYAYEDDMVAVVEAAAPALIEALRRFGS